MKLYSRAILIYGYEYIIIGELVIWGGSMTTERVAFATHGYRK